MLFQRKHLLTALHANGGSSAQTSPFRIEEVYEQNETIQSFANFKMKDFGAMPYETKIKLIYFATK
jgi:hypothetical protein